MSFSFLERSVRILVVDDEPGLVAVYREHLNAYPLYTAACAGSAQEADAVLSSSRGCHVCLLDLGLDDIDNDEYYLIKKYSPKTSFIIVSARDSLEKGFRAGSCGAFAAMKKPVDFFNLDIFNLVNEAFFRSVVTPENMSRCKSFIRDAVDVLIGSRPDSVKQWANRVKVNDRYLRKVWGDCFEYQPKLILWFNKYFYFATLYYNNFYRKKFNIKTGVDGTRIEHADRYGDQPARVHGMHKHNVRRILNGVKAS